MKTEPPAINESPSTGCEFANIQYQNAATKNGGACESENPAPLPKPSPEPPVSFYEAAYYWILTRS
jgi:hypothetical protein